MFLTSLSSAFVEGEGGDMMMRQMETLLRQEKNGKAYVFSLRQYTKEGRKTIWDVLAQKVALLLYVYKVYEKARKI